MTNKDNAVKITKIIIKIAALSENQLVHFPQLIRLKQRSFLLKDTTLLTRLTTDTT